MQRRAGAMLQLPFRQGGMPAPAAWRDLALPAGQVGRLRAIAARARGKSMKSGLAVLFADGSRSERLAAARTLALELGAQLAAVDLSTVAGKYIGETEKNLARIFSTAQRSGVVLFFDEADAVFGRRSGVKDAHDRYANIEVSHLLSRMEKYRGLSILSANRKSAIYPVVRRRIRREVVFA